MRRLIVALCALVVLGMGFSLPASANHKDGLCPFMVSKNAKELGLSKDQITQVEKVKAEVTAAQNKADADLNKILTKKQKDDYKKLGKNEGHKGHHGKKDGSCDDCKKGDCKGKDKQCPMHKKK